MSGKYSAVAAVGLRVPKAALYRTERRFWCNHSGQTDGPFCPSCGRKCEHVSVPVVDTLYGADPNLDGWPVVFANHFDGGEVVVCESKSAPAEKAAGEVVTAAGLAPGAPAAAFVEAMTARGLWDAVRYGLHVVLVYTG